MNDMKKQEEAATNRFMLLAPLLDQGLDQAKSVQMRKEIAKEANISERTLRRYLKRYEEQGFEGLKAKANKNKGNTKIPEDILDEAILLRRELTTRSVRTIIQILEAEGKIEKGEIKRSTLQEQLSQKGYSSRQMRIYKQTTTNANRFEKPYRNALWQADIKYGPMINGKATYMVGFIDDRTRFIVHSEYYDSLEQKIVQDSFRKALLKYGAPDCVYFDNGVQFRTKWMSRACAKMGIRLLFCKPFAAASKGKIEVYNRFINSFHAEISLKKPTTLDEMNQLYKVWMEECYQHKAHSALKEMITPHDAYHSDVRPLRLLDTEVIADAFLYCESRVVDKTGCLSFQGIKYEVEHGRNYIGKKVQIIFDIQDISKLTVEYDGLPISTATPLEIGSYCKKGNNEVSSNRSTEQPTTSRLLDAIIPQYEERAQIKKNAIAFSDIGDDNHV